MLRVSPAVKWPPQLLPTKLTDADDDCTEYPMMDWPTSMERLQLK